MNDEQFTKDIEKAKKVLSDESINSFTICVTREGDDIFQVGCCGKLSGHDRMLVLSNIAKTSVKDMNTVDALTLLASAFERAITHTAERKPDDVAVH